MAFDSLTDKLQNVFRKLRSKGTITEADVKEAMKEVKRALLEADVNFKVVKQFINSVSERAVGEEVLADLDPLAQEKNIKLTGKCKNITMVGSDILIYRLVYNLVENAIKYNHSGGQVTVTAYRKEKHVYLSVEDTGNGIPEELRERVFEPFFRVDKSRSRELGGVGLGLALVREIVRVHDGSIAVRSNPSGGTVFDVILPL